MRIPHKVPVAVGLEFVDLAQDVAAAILRTLRVGWDYGFGVSRRARWC